MVAVIKKEEATDDLLQEEASTSFPGRKDPEQEGHSLSFSVWKKK